MHPPLGSIARIPDPGKESRVIFSLHSLKNPAPGWIPHGKNVGLLYHTFFEIKIFLAGTFYPNISASASILPVVQIP